MKKQRLHLKAPDNWINDPNGFLYYKGYYHLFYQYFPYAPRWGTMHWGHAVSKDMVNWEHVGLALFPTKRGDQNGCFSGSAVEMDGKMYLTYTGVRYEEVDPENVHVSLDDKFESTQMMISSEDGFHFDNWNGKKVVLPPVTDETVGDRTHTRDPKVWRGKEKWYMVLGSTQKEEQGVLLFYESMDLQNWKLVNRKVKTPEYGWMWECPDYFETEGGKVLLLSAMKLIKSEEMQRNHSICFAVDFQEDTCDIEIPDTYQFVDYGLDLYAPQTTLDEEGRRTMVAWIRMPEPTKEGWIGMFCCPRIVECKDGHIYFHMHPNIRNACSREIQEIKQADRGGYRVLFELQDGEEVDIGGFRIYRCGNKICTDRSRVFPHGKGFHLQSQTPDVKEGSRIEVLVDENLAEVFVNDGEYVISNAVYGLGTEITANIQSEIKLYTINASEG